MSNEWKDRVIRGGFVTIATVAAVGCVSALIAVTMGAPAALRAGSAFSPWLPESDCYPSPP